ncbi:sugar transferase [Haloarcula onubensis]|uniref:Sugar transferase n=1 Tax=Haloarcula onubensis TaxID=2950539 RepID=A0ABU2FNC4_9EURY|nr:sugar transferase [Halomicroarcula sp. S3CR25-11]MDS0282269.1 sugar transferase [Halomicroarcula sp. S3CR25-11]
MQSGWRYRLVAVCGATLWVAGAVVVANAPLTQMALTAIPPLDNLQPTTYTNGQLLDQIATTLLITLAVLWPLFKPRPRRILDTISLTHKRVFLTAAVLATIGYFDWSSRLPRTTLVATVLFLGVVLPMWFVAIRRRPSVSKRAIIVGDDTIVMKKLYESATVPIIGVVAPSGVRSSERPRQVADGGMTIESASELPRLGGLSRLDAVLVEHDIDTVLLAFEQPDREEFFGALATCFEHGVQAKVHREHADSVLVADAAGGDLVDTHLEPWDWQDYAVKRVFDVAFSSIALVCLAPLVLVITIAIKLGSRGPILYTQTRTAAFGEIFTIYKFRTMRTGEPDTAPDSDENHRITRVGRYLRQTHLDEIPQLWSILVGDMSVVGPRAAWTDEERHLEAETSEWRKRWFVKPGLTGLAQINDMTSEDPREKLRYDIQYIRQQSFSFDLKIVLRQLYSVFVDVGSLIGEKIRTR